MISGELSWSRSARWQSIHYVLRTFHSWVRPPGRFFADKAGGKGDLSVNWTTAASSGYNFDQDALMIPSVSEMYPMAILRLFWELDSFLVASRFRGHCHSSKNAWTLAILCNFHSSTSPFMSKSFSVLGASNARSLPSNITFLIEANFLLWHVCIGSCLGFLTASSQPRLGQRKPWNPLWHLVLLLRINRVPH